MLTDLALHLISAPIKFKAKNNTITINSELNGFINLILRLIQSF
jgi:hypothetical protein